MMDSKRYSFALRVLSLKFIFCALILSGCIHNYEPKIDSINADPNPAPMGSVVNLTCNASDNDESSMLKQESLDYSWSCAYGQITSENNDNKATWVSPDIVGAYSISCTVTDQYNGVDIYTIEVIVE